MTATVEHIKKAISSLAPAEVDELLRDLQLMYVMPLPEGEDAASIEAEWDAEIDLRVKEIEGGRVELLSGEDSDRWTDAVFARMGIKRPVHHP
jgi:hypothetical protein